MRYRCRGCEGDVKSVGHEAGGVLGLVFDNERARHLAKLDACNQSNAKQAPLRGRCKYSKGPQASLLRASQPSLAAQTIGQVHIKKLARTRVFLSENTSETVCFVSTSQMI
jgi:hypothetical protein